MSKAFIAVIVCCFISACSSTPKVKYDVFRQYTSASKQANKVDFDGKIKFKLSGSLLLLTANGDANATNNPSSSGSAPQNDVSKTKNSASKAKKSTPSVGGSNQAATSSDDITVTVTKSSSSNDTIFMMPDDGWGVSTDYSLTYYDNSLILKSLGTAMQDNRVTYIKDAGEFIAAAVPIAMTFFSVPLEEKPELKLPTTIDVEDYFTFCDNENTATVNCWRPLPGSTGWVYNISLSNLPSPTAVPRNDFFDKFKKDSTTSFPVVSCRDAVLHLKTTDGSTNKASHITIADPKFLETVKIPAKGSIDSMDICGANVTLGSSNSSDWMQIAGQVFTEANNIKKAYSDAKNPSSSTPKSTTTGSK